MENHEFFICECSSYEHQMFVWWDDDVMYFVPHLITHRNFFQRLWYGIKYAFGYKSRYGAWDEFIFNEDNLKTLQKFLNDKYNNSKS